VTVQLDYRRTRTAHSCAFEVGEHVLVDGREPEYVVVEVDRITQTLKLLPVGCLGRIESFPAVRVRVVLPPGQNRAMRKRPRLMDSAIPPLRDLPRLRDRVTVEGHEGIFIVIACNSQLREVDLAGTSRPGYLFGIPVSKLRPVSNQPLGRLSPQIAPQLSHLYRRA
jgi:hypothetical protein